MVFKVGAPRTPGPQQPTFPIIEGGDVPGGPLPYIIGWSAEKADAERIGAALNLATMTDDEMLRRAREAAVTAQERSAGWPADVVSAQARLARAGRWDSGSDVRAAMQALRDLIAPPVDPLLIEARRIAAKAYRAAHETANAVDVEAGNQDDTPAVQATLAALRSREPQS